MRLCVQVLALGSFYRHTHIYIFKDCAVTPAAEVVRPRPGPSLFCVREWVAEEGPEPASPTHRTAGAPQRFFTKMTKSKKKKGKQRTKEKVSSTLCSVFLGHFSWAASARVSSVGAASPVAGMHASAWSVHFALVSPAAPPVAGGFYRFYYIDPLPQAGISTRKKNSTPISATATPYSGRGCSRDRGRRKQYLLFAFLFCTWDTRRHHDPDKPHSVYSLSNNCEQL